MPEGTDANKKNPPNKCDLFHYWYFLDKKLSFNHIFCNDYHDLLKKL